MKDGSEKATAIREYDRFAKVWADWRPSKPFRDIFDETVTKILARYNGCEVSVVDAGCGHGTWLKIIADYCKLQDIRLRATAVDLSESRLEIARRQLGQTSELTFIHGDLEHTYFPRGIDLIYTAEVFQHFGPAQQERILRQWKEALNPKGTIVIIDKDRRSWHAMKVKLQLASGRIGRRLLGRHRLFSEDLVPLFSEIVYPSFKYLSKIGKDLGLTAQRLVEEKPFCALELSLFEPS